MLIQAIPAVILGILTVFFWKKGRSRESVLILEGKLDRDTIIDDGIQTVPLVKQILHIFSRFNIVLMIINGWIHNSVL